MRVIAVATTYGEEDLEEADAVATSLQASALTTESGARFELRVVTG